MEARSYTLSELESHLQQSFDENSPLIPVSPQRAISYLNNPRARPSDHVLYEMRDGETLVAYRTLLPDHYYDKNGIARRFAWLSGNYVLPEYRRKGISTRLLELVESRWEGRLMYTNYAPESKAVYDSSGQFRVLAKREGARYYLRSASAELLKGRTLLHPLLPLADRILNRLVERKLKKFVPDIPGAFRITRIRDIDEGLEALNPEPDRESDRGKLSGNKGEPTSGKKGGSLFRRERDEFQWILRYPWVTSDPVDPIPYHFSYFSVQFENLLFRFDPESKGEAGWAWLVVNGNKLAVPYLYAPDPGILNAIAGKVIDAMVRYRCAYVTVRHTGLREALEDRRKWFLAVRSMPQLIFYHNQMAGQFPDGFALQDGDGDLVFTG